MLQRSLGKKALGVKVKSSFVIRSDVVRLKLLNVSHVRPIKLLRNIVDYIPRQPDVLKTLVPIIHALMGARVLRIMEHQNATAQRGSLEIIVKQKIFAITTNVFMEEDVLKNLESHNANALEHIMVSIVNRKIIAIILHACIKANV
jgi:hypothetical protein